MKRKPTQVKGSSSPEAIAIRRVVRESDPLSLIQSAIALPEEDHVERQHLLFYQDDGGIRATDEVNQNLDTIYYLGIIDILTPYTMLKKAEHLWKGMSADRVRLLECGIRAFIDVCNMQHKISPVPPPEYGDRFFAFMRAIMRGGEGGTRFKAE